MDEAELNEFVQDLLRRVADAIDTGYCDPEGAVEAAAVHYDPQVPWELGVRVDLFDGTELWLQADFDRN